MISPGPETIAVIGEALIDLTEAGDDEPRLARPGGSPYNVAVGLARLERPTVLVGRLSRDPLGDVLRRHAERSGVDLRLAINADEPTTIALVELRDGVAQYRFGIEGTADFRWTDAELDRVPSDLAAVHFGSLASWTPPGDQAIARCIARLRDRTLVSYDPNVRPHLQPDRAAARDKVERALTLAHVVKTSAEDIDWLYPGVAPERVAAAWLDAGPSVVVVTGGADGAAAHTRCHRVARAVPRVDVVDTVGAGDAFTAGLLDALAGRQLLKAAALPGLAGAVLAEVLDAAALVAALTCARAGANPPRRADLLAAG